MWFSPLQVKKIEMMREFLDALVTRKELINYLIDGAYMGALKTLCDDGRITKRDRKDCLKFIPSYLNQGALSRFSRHNTQPLAM